MLVACRWPRVPDQLSGCRAKNSVYSLLQTATVAIPPGDLELDYASSGF